MQSKITTNTNLIAFSRDNKLTMIESIPLFKEGGFDTLDLNFCEMMNPDSALNDNRAGGYIKKLKDLRDEYNLTYFQCHVPYPRDSEESNKSDKAISRALEFAEDLDIPVAVIHPIKGSIDDNIAYFNKFIKSTDKITLAIENMDREDEIYSVNELSAIVSSIDRAGICLDVGHANIRGLDIASFIRKAGDKLIATHIHDNNGINDLHLLPGLGTINWEEVMKAFRECYSGYINYEAMYFSRNLPSSFRSETLRLAKEIGNWLFTL